MNNFLAIILITIISFFNIICVARGDDRDAARAEAAAIASGLSSKINEATRTSDLKEAVPNYETDSPEETKYNENNIKQYTLEKSHTSEEAKLVRDSAINRPEVKISTTEEWLQKSDKVQNNPKDEINFLTGNYGDCKKEGGEPIINYETKTCDEYAETNSNQCSIGRQVEVKADHLYKCNKERTLYERKCNKQLQVVCKGGSRDCTFSESLGGIKQGTVTAGVVFRYSPPNLIIGPETRDGWFGACTIYDNEVNFHISNVDKIKTFRLKRLIFDDHIEVKVNGHSVYRGPDESGKFIELVQVKQNRYTTATMVYNGISNSPCELDTNWDRSPDRDLKPYLKSGLNTISFRVIVTGNGEGTLYIEASQNCCDLVEEWTDNCKGIPL
jgi:hypothetical protein